MEEQEKTTQIEGTVAAVVYENPENGYCVLRLNTGDDVVTAVGCFPGAAVGERLSLTGGWTTHPSYGEQFAAETVRRTLPRDRDAIYAYLAFGGVRGVGKVLAAAIVRAFGEEALQVIENEPEKLAEIRGITRKKALQIADDFRRQVGLRRLMEFLTANGLRAQFAVRLYRAYGDEAAQALRDNPYILTQTYFGANFFEADELALRLGFAPDSRERIEAAVLFELRHNLGNGHTFLPRGKLTAATNQLIEVGEEAVEEALDMLEEGGYVICEQVAGVEACYLESLHRAETSAAARLLDLVRAESAAVNTETLVADAERSQGIVYAGLQRRAVALAAENRVLVLTGGPGTGKTTSVRGILTVFDRLGLKTVLAAPTGRAAKRMTELTGREAKTVHRLLGAGYSDDDSELVFEHDRDDPLDADAVILDETSMVDIQLLAALLDAMPAGCRLVLVGDADQLPSVGPGNVLGDILRSGVIPSVSLTEVFRQAERSDIVANAHRINSGELPELTKNKGDFFFLRRTAAEGLAETVVELCARRLPEKMGIPADQIQVLAPSRRQETGTVQLNRRLQAAVNPASPQKRERAMGDFTFREGDRVMQIRNNYDILWKKSDGSAVGTGVFNGDIGRILTIDPALEAVQVEFDDRIVTYAFDQLTELEPAYAMTVHKSQGSEYRAVVLALGRSAPALLARNVLYTAVTRAKELLILVGDEQIVAQMVANDRRRRRYSGLRARLAEGL